MKEWGAAPGKFLEAYAGAQRRLSELGARLVGDRGVPAVAVAKKQTSLVSGREGEGGREGGRERGREGEGGRAAAQGTIWRRRRQEKTRLGDGDGRKTRFGEGDGGNDAI